MAERPLELIPGPAPVADTGEAGSGAQGDAQGVPRCVLCRINPPGTPMAVCYGCHGRLRRLLISVVQLYATLTPVPGQPGRGVNAGSKPPGFESKSPANDEIIVLTDYRSEDAVFQVLHAWAEIIIADRGLPPDIGVSLSVQTEAHVIITNLRWLTQDVDYAKALWLDLVKVLRRMRNASGDRPPRRPRPVDPSLPVLISTKAAAARHGVAVGTIRSWASTDGWVPYGPRHLRRWNRAEVDTAARSRSGETGGVAL